MKIIDTSKVTPTADYPGLANVNGQSIGNGGTPSKFEGLDFLQQAVMDMANALSGAILSSTLLPTILSGCGTGFTGNIGSGWVYYNGEIFQVNAQAIGGTPNTYIAANITANPTDDGTNAPLTELSDGSTVSMHNQRTITFTYSATQNSGNMPDFGQWVYMNVNAKWGANTAHSLAYKNGYSSLEYTTTNASTYRLDNNGNVYVSAFFSSPGSISSQTIATLPSGYAPLNPRNFPLWERTSGIWMVAQVDTSGNINVMTTAGGNVPNSDTFSFEAFYNLIDA